MTFANIVPIQRLPRSLGSFTYELPDILVPTCARGSWVRVPFRGRLVDGIVWEIHQRTLAVKTLRAVERMLPLPLLSTEQLHCAVWLSQTSFVSLALALKTMLPQRPIRKGKNAESPSVEPDSITLKRDRLEVVRSAVKKTITSNKSKVFVQLGNFAERAAYFHLLLGTRKTRQQLLLVPTKHLLMQYAAFFAKRFGKRVCLLDQEETPAQLWLTWQRIAEMKNAIILTTKKGLFAPLHDIETILIDQATDESHKQWDQNPRYDARSVAIELQRLWSAQLVLLDAEPSLALSIDSSLYNILSSTASQSRRVLTTNWLSPGHPAAVLSDEAVALLAETQGPSLIFCNRTGAARITFCKDCGWEFSCPDCHIPLTRYGKASYQCARCGKDVALPLTCPSCTSTHFVALGIGTERIEQEIRTLLPGKSVQRIDRTRATQSGVGADITIATEQIFSSGPLPSFDVLVVPSFDAMVQIPDYAAAERAYLLLEHVAALGKSGSTMLVQTMTENQDVLRAFQMRKSDALYAPELVVRQRLRLAPAVRLLKLELSGTDKNDIARQTADAFTILEHVISTHDTLGNPDYVEKRSSKRPFVASILLRLSGPSIPATLQHALMNLSDSWLVDVDPRSITP